MTPEKILYETTVVAQGGREGTAESADGSFAVKLSVPKGLGGPGGEGTNPEQLFAAGYAACFLGAVKLVARTSKIALSEDTSISAKVGIGRYRSAMRWRSSWSPRFPALSVPSPKRSSPALMSAAPIRMRPAAMSM